jgi:hypothetical protein
MPRPKPGQERRRVARACDSCKRRKEKCDGLQPCSLCKRRNQESACAYSNSRNGGLPAQSHLEESPTAPVQPHEDMFDHSDREVTIESPLHLSHGGASGAAAPHAHDSEVTTSAPVPKLSRMLRDGTGKFSMDPTKGLSSPANGIRSIYWGLGVPLLSPDYKTHCHFFNWPIQLHHR